jgi:hypothetical protein
VEEEEEEDSRGWVEVDGPRKNEARYCKVSEGGSSSGGGWRVR